MACLSVKWNKTTWPRWELWRVQRLELFGLSKQLDNRHTWEIQEKQMSTCRTYCHKKCSNETISVWAPKIENETGVSKQSLQWDKEMGFVNWTWKRVRVGMTERDIHLKAVWLKLFLAVIAQTVESLFSFSVVKYLQLSFAYMCMKNISIRCKCVICAKYFTHADVANCRVMFT